MEGRLDVENVCGRKPDGLGRNSRKRFAEAAGDELAQEWKPEFKAEGRARLVYEIEPMGASAKLTLTHSMERPDSTFIGAVSEGWPLVLSNLKSLLETGDVAVVYHRRQED